MSDWDVFGRDFGAEVHALVIERGISMVELARRSGVNRSYLNDLVHGRRGQRGPSSLVVARVAAALDVEPEHFRITRVRRILAHPKAVDAIYVYLKNRGQIAA